MHPLANITPDGQAGRQTDEQMDGRMDGIYIYIDEFMVMDRWKRYAYISSYYRSQALSSRLGAATLRVCPTLSHYC